MQGRRMWRGHRARKVTVILMVDGERTCGITLGVDELPPVLTVAVEVAEPEGESMRGPTLARHEIPIIVRELLEGIE